MTGCGVQIRVFVHAEAEGIEALAPEWAALEARCPEATGFQNFDWCAVWLREAAWREEPLRPRVVTVREAERLVMLWPLQVETRFGATIARWIGEPMTQYGDALAEPGAGRSRWRAAAEAEMARWRDVDLVALTRLRADGVVSASGAAIRFCESAVSAPFLDLRAGGCARRHKSVERRARRLERLGPLSFEESLDPAARESAARRALAMKRAWLDEKGLMSVGLSAPTTGDFLAGAARAGVLRVHVLRVGGEPAAIDLGLCGGGFYRLLLVAYDPRFAQGSPGQVLTARLIERCAALGLSGFDLLAPADPYKFMWAGAAVAMGERYAPRTLKGRAAAFALARLRPLAKRAVKRVVKALASRVGAAPGEVKAIPAPVPALKPIPLSRQML
jgi:CelD/BcsL family acetyltransferase involved in cellulose biosynthesis